MDFIELPPGHVPVGRRKPGLIVALRQKMAKLQNEQVEVVHSLLARCNASLFPGAFRDQLTILLNQLITSGKARAYYQNRYGARHTPKCILDRWTRIKNDWSRSVKIEILEEEGEIRVLLTAI